MRGRASLGPGLVRVRRPTLLAAAEIFLDCRLPSETLPLLPLRMTEDTIGDPSTSSGNPSGPRHGHTIGARSDVVATAALTRRRRPSRSGMLFRRIRPEPTAAADRQPGRRPEDDRQLHPAHRRDIKPAHRGSRRIPGLSRDRPTALPPWVWVGGSLCPFGGNRARYGDIAVSRP